MQFPSSFSKLRCMPRRRDVNTTTAAVVDQENPTIIDSAAIARFQRDGFLPWGRVLDDDLLAAARDAYDRIFSESRDSGGARNLVHDSTYRSEHDSDGGGRMLQIMNCYRRHPCFQRLIHHQAILDPIKALIGPHLQLYHDQALFKPARDGRPVFWHQDNGYWGVQPATLVSCWLTLDDADEDNGAMQFIPGSHLAAHGHQRSEQTNALLDIGEHVDTGRAVTVPLRAGCCLFHHCQTAHFTDINRSERDRRAFIIHVMTPGSRKQGQVMPAGYHHPILSSTW